MVNRKSDWNLTETPKPSETKEIVTNVGRFGMMTKDKVAELYGNIAHLVSEEHREYLEGFLNDGNQNMDVVLDLEMFMRLVTIYAYQAVLKAFEHGDVKKDISSLLGEVRQSAVAIESMRNKRAELAEKANKNDDDEDMAPSSRESALSILKDLDQ